MSIFSAPSFYAAPDRQTYSAGNFFIPQEKYTFGGVPRYLMPSGITATTAANAIPPILPINQGGGGDGGGGNITGPVDNSGFDYETDAYGLDDMSAKDKGLTEEEQDALDDMNNPGLTTGMKGTLAGMFTGFFNPLTAIASLTYQQKKQQEALEEKARQAAIEADFQREAAKGNRGADFTGGRYDGADSKSDYDADPTGFSGSSKDGGIIGYGGKSGTPRYQQFMNGGLANLVDIYD